MYGVGYICFRDGRLEFIKQKVGVIVERYNQKWRAHSVEVLFFDPNSIAKYPLDCAPLEPLDSLCWGRFPLAIQVLHKGTFFEESKRRFQLDLTNVKVRVEASMQRGRNPAPTAPPLVLGVPVDSNATPGNQSKVPPSVVGVVTAEAHVVEMTPVNASV